MHSKGRTRILAALTIAGATFPATADDLTFTNTCATGNWFSSCTGAPCGGGFIIFNNWGRSSCGVVPALPSLADSADIGVRIVEASGVPGAEVTAGDLRIPTGGVLNLLDTSIHTTLGTVDGAINIRGFGITVRGSLTLRGTATFYGIADFQNATWLNAGDFEVQGGNFAAPGNGTLTNDGTLRKTGQIPFTSYPAFVNHGTVHAQEGLLQFNNSVESAPGATWRTSPGATLQFPGTTLKGRFDIASEGTALLDGFWVHPDGAALHASGNGAMLAGHPIILYPRQFTNEAGSLLTFAPGFILSGIDSWGSFVNRGQVQVSTPGDFYWLNVSNEGSWVFSGGAANVQTPLWRFTNTGTLVLNQTGRVELPETTNFGNIEVNSGTVALRSFLFHRAGQLSLAGGAIETTGFGIVQLEGGTCQGIGNHSAILFNFGAQLHPGAPFGRLRLRGFDQDRDGVLNIEIGGNAQDDQYDHVFATDYIVLGGTLRVRLVNGFRPRSGDYFTFINTLGTRSGGFSTLDLPAGFRVFYSASRAELGFTDVCPPDFNLDGTVNSGDLFDYLTAFFASTASSDFNHDGLRNSQDFFDFLSAFFTGC